MLEGISTQSSLALKDTLSLTHGMPLPLSRGSRSNMRHRQTTPHSLHFSLLFFLSKQLFGSVPEDQCGSRFQQNYSIILKSSFCKEGSESGTMLQVKSIHTNKIKQTRLPACYIQPKTNSTNMVKGKASSSSSSSKDPNIFLFVPNLIGYARIVLGIASLFYMREDPYVAMPLYWLSAFLDAFDGQAARYLDQGELFFFRILFNMEDLSCSWGLCLKHERSFELDLGSFYFAFCLCGEFFFCLLFFSHLARHQLWQSAGHGQRPVSTHTCAHIRTQSLSLREPIAHDEKMCCQKKNSHVLLLTHSLADAPRWRCR